jgi:hypothetical protein
LPERLTGRPDGVLLAAEWPWLIHTMQAGNLLLSNQDSFHAAVYTDLVPDTDSTSGPFRFDVKTGAWA